MGIESKTVEIAPTPDPFLKPKEEKIEDKKADVSPEEQKKEEEKPAPVVKKPRAIIESEDIFDFSNIKPIAKVEAPKKEEPVKKVAKPVVIEKKSNNISNDYDLGNLF